MSPKFSPLLFLFFLLMVPTLEGKLMAKSNCSDRCGDVVIPFPFGIGSNCSMKDSYTIVCKVSSTNSSKPYLSILNLEVLNVSLSDQTITLSTPVPRLCHNEGINVKNWSSFDLAGSPFFFSKDHNQLMLFGCGSAIIKQKEVLSACTSICNFNSNATGCYGTHCCQTSIPFYLTKYQLNFTISEFSNSSYSCSSAVLADQKWLPPGRYSDILDPKSFKSVPLVLSWTLQIADLRAISGCTTQKSSLEVESGEPIENWQCLCPFKINPYIDGPCIYEVQSQGGTWSTSTGGKG